MTSKLVELKKILKEGDYKKWNPDYEVLYQDIYKLYRKKKWAQRYGCMMWQLAWEQAYESGELDEEEQSRQEEIENWRDIMREERSWQR